MLALAWAATPHAQPEPEKETAPQPSAAAGGSASADRDEAESRRLFSELDRNGDGYLTRDELWSDRGRQGNWAAVDRNRDGRISPDEFTVLRSR